MLDPHNDLSPVPVTVPWLVRHDRQGLHCAFGGLMKVLLWLIAQVPVPLNQSLNALAAVAHIVKHLLRRPS